MEFVEKSKEIYVRAVDEYNPSHVFCLFSGGHDSLCVTHLIRNVFSVSISGVVHINTGVGIQNTEQYVKEVSEKYGWSLKEYTPPVSYEQLVVRHGFPGPAAHTYIYSWLKERAVRSLVREHKTRHKDRILLITGVRRSESVRRMGIVQEIQRSGCQVWVAPIIDWSESDKAQYIKHYGLLRNEVVDIMHMSGECLCGAFARPDEFKEWKFWFPDDPSVKLIESLQNRLSTEKPLSCVWGSRPRKSNLALCQHCERYEPDPI